MSVLDTSVLVAREQGRVLGELPSEWTISVMTLAELYVGVLMADDETTRRSRLKTVVETERAVTPLPVDRETSIVLSELIAALRREGRKVNLADAIIAATARRHGLPVYTQDDDFEAFPGVEVIRV